jgi:hypothetical protein
VSAGGGSLEGAVRAHLEWLEWSTSAKGREALGALEQAVDPAALDGVFVAGWTEAIDAIVAARPRQIELLTAPTLEAVLAILSERFDARRAVAAWALWFTRADPSLQAALADRLGPDGLVKLGSVFAAGWASAVFESAALILAERGEV